MHAYTCVVCLCVCVCARAYICVCVCVHMHLCEYVCMCTLELAYMCSFLNAYTRGKGMKWKGWGEQERDSQVLSLM